jgi:hypothetical protein
MLRINFKQDWKEYLKNQFQELGFLYNENESPEDNTVRYFRISRRLISKKKRKVFISKSLIVSPEFKTSFDEIVRRLENGEDIKPYQSRLTKKTEINDLLLNDWGIHHLHLGDTLESDDYIKRTTPLLYAMFIENAVYLIAILNHGQWTNTDLIQIMHDNWKDVMVKFKIVISPLSISEDQRKILRNKHGNAIVTVSDGTTYGPPGGGIMASGDCMFDINNTDKIFFDIENWESIVKSNEERFFEGAKIDKNQILTIKLNFDQEECYLYEPDKKIRFNLKNKS